MHTCVFEAEEHGCKEADKKFLEEIEEFNEKEHKNNELKYLGLKKYNPFLDFGCDCEEECNKVQADYYIGYRWFKKNESYICVKPKVYNNKRADFLAMFLEILNDPIVSKKANKIYQIFFDEPLIEVEVNKDYSLEFLILHFLKVVNDIVKKGLKKGYLKVEENLTSKIKGKILVNKTIKYNLSKNRPDKTYCNHQMFTINCLENQILKTALLQCRKVVSLFKNEEINKIFRQNLAAFELVDTKEVFNTDFFKIKYSTFFKDYKIALNLAKMIFKRLGFSLNSKEVTNKIYPYLINMPELFERYVEVKLRKKYSTVIDGNERSFCWQMRPDFLLPSEKYIVDAKYKFWYGMRSNSKFKDDFSQLTLYSRCNSIRKDLGLKNENEVIDLIFIYPNFNKKYKELEFKNKRKEKEFFKIYKLPLKIPLIKINDNI